MPYTKDNPPEKIKGLPAHAQDVWISAFNSAYENTPEGRDKEEYAVRVAWAAVKKAGYKQNEDGKWIKEEVETFNCECIECGHKMKSEKHCADIKCPECGGQMRRTERPGPGQTKEEIIDRGDKPLEKIKIRESNAFEGEKIKPRVFRVELMNLEEPNVSHRGWSENNKYYSDRALESLVKLMENKRSMATGHHDGEHLRELGGILKNVRKIPEKKIIEADYKILHQNPEWLESVIIEQTNSPGANLATLSIIAKGSGFKGKRGGKTGEIIENIHKAIGTDLVFEAGAGGKFKSLLESKRRKKMEDITIEELKKERPDLVEMVLQEEKKKVSDLEVKVKDFEAKELIAQSKILAERLIRESKLTEGQAIGLMGTMIGKTEEQMKEEIENRKKFLKAIAPEIKVTNLSEKDNSTAPKPLTETEKTVIKQLGITEEAFRKGRGEIITEKKKES